MINTSRLMVCASAVLASSTMAWAADLVPVEEYPVVEERIAPAWTFSIDPFYGWIPGMNGDVRVFGNEVHIDVTTGDILNNIDTFLHAVDGIYMGAGEWRNGPYGLSYDVFYMDVSGAREFGNRVITGAADLGFSLTMITLAGNYRFFESSTSYADVIAGARYTKVNTDLDLTLGQLASSASDGDSWVDPVVGIRGRHVVNEHWYVKGQALYGGFGVSSDHLYDLSAFLGYQCANGIELYGGWRTAYTDYENGSFKWDVTMSGPMLGLTLKF